jgi:peptidoglycan/LPS O-acetylase OafA/YrhL
VPCQDWTSVVANTPSQTFRITKAVAANARQAQLDSLRALSVLIVVFVHTMRPSGAVMADFAPLAVALFFVLSGFLITGILLEARARAEASGVGRGSVLGRFYIRRFLRIFPIYYAILAIAVLLGEPTTRRYLWELVTYRQNFLMARLGHNLSPITPLWSLAVEEHFYLIWPLVVLFASRRGIWAASAFMIVGSLGARVWLQLHHASSQAITMPTYTAVDSIALGCVLGLMWRDTTEEVRRPWLRRALWVGIGLELARVVLFLVPVWHNEAVVRVLNTLPFAMACVWLIDRGAHDRLPNWLRNRFLAKLGLVSYAVYVGHRYVMHFLGYDNDRGFRVFFPVLIVSVILALLSWLVYEGPINRLNRFFPYVRRPEPPPAHPSRDAGARVEETERVTA